MIEDKYIGELQDSDVRNLEYWCSQYGLEDYIDMSFGHIDCTKCFPNGIRVCQTVDYKYSIFMAELLYLINKVEDEDKKKELLFKLEEVHENNLKFEETTPPLVYDKKLSKPKSKSRTTKERTPREKGPTVAERKLIEKAKKIASLKFSIKPKAV